MAKPRTGLRILEVNKFYPPHVGGIERVVQDLTSGFAARGHRVRVLACRSGRGPRRIVRRDGAVVIYARSFGTVLSTPISLDFLRLFFRLQRWADIVHWHEPFPPATLACLLAPRRAGRVVTWHSDIVRQRFLKPLLDRLQRLALGRADLVVPTSARLARFSAVVDAGSPKTMPVPIGLPLAALTGVDEAQARRWVREVRPFPRYALFVGRLVYYKGIDVLLEAASAVAVPLVVVGSGPLAPWVREEVTRRGLEHRVHLVERPVDDEELKLFYRHCAFLVLPSTHPAEAFGMVQVEAMAFGKPVVNTRLPTGVPAVSIDGRTGITVPPGDPVALAAALERLWRDPELCARLGRAALTRARREFDRERMVERYLDLFAACRAGADAALAPARPRAASRAAPCPRDREATVALVCPRAAPRRCGVEDYTDRLAEALAASGIGVRRLDGIPLRRADLAGCDLVHLQYPAIGFGASLLPHLLPFRSPAPVVATLHEFSLVNHARKLSCLLFSLGLHRLVFTTEDELRAFRGAFPWWRAEATVIPIGSNIPFLGRDSDPEPVVLFFGHVKPNRNLEAFLSLAELAVRRGQPCRFRVVGSIAPGQEAYFQALRRRAAALPVEWLLDLGPEEVARQACRAGAAYLPFPDGASPRRGSLLALLGNGVPVVTTDGSSCPRALRAAVRFAADPGEALRQVDEILGRPELARALSRAGRAYADRFAWPGIAAAHLALYRAILAGRAPTARVFAAPAGR